MEQGIVYIIMGVLSIALFFVGRYVFPAAGKVIQSAMNLLEAYPMLFKWATSACQYIAKYFNDIPGEQKNKKAAEIIMQIASQVGIEMTEEQARAIAPAAYEAIKNGTAESGKEGALIPEGVSTNA